MLQASKITGEVYAVWAAQGPFESGEASAKAMHYANLAVRGMDSSTDKEFKEVILKHARAYDDDPARWEALRRDSLSLPKNEKFEEQLALAEHIANNTEVINKLGEKLLDEGSKESKDLLALLNEIYKSRHGRDIEDSVELGFIYAQVYSESLRYPEEDIYRLFIQLRDRWEKAISANK